MHSPLLREFAQHHNLEFLSDFSADGSSHEYVYSRDEGGQKVHRFAYLQIWDCSLPLLLWIMLNPGTGDTEKRKRPTLERCKRWSARWGYGGLLIGNLFSFRAKSAKELRRSGTLTDPRNEAALRLLRSLAAETVVAWGNHGHRLQGVDSLLQLLAGAACLGFTKTGQPRHPLYVPNNAERCPWPISPMRTDS